MKLLALAFAVLCLSPSFFVPTIGQKPAALGGAVSTDAVIGPVNWPQFRFNDKHTGLNTSEKLLTRKTVRRLQLAWQAQLGKIVDYSSPAVVDGVVYIGSVDGRLWAYSADGCGSGFCAQPLWTSVGLGQILDSPAVSNGTVYVGSQTSDDSNDGRLNAFRASGCGHPVCAPLWQGLAGSESILQSSPAVAKGMVYRRCVRRSNLCLQRHRVRRGALRARVAGTDRRHDRIDADHRRRRRVTSDRTTGSCMRSRQRAAARRIAHRCGPAGSAGLHSIRRRRFLRGSSTSARLTRSPRSRRPGAAQRPASLSGRRPTT